MHGHPVRDPNPQRGDLPVLRRGGAGHPHAGAPVDAARGGHSGLADHLDECFFDAAHIIHHVDGVRQLDDGVCHQLAGAVPGDAAAPVHVDDGQPVRGPVLWLGAFAGCVDAGVFQHDDGVADVAVCPLRRQVGLHVPRREIIHRA